MTDLQEFALSVLTGRGLALPLAVFFALAASTSLPELATDVNAAVFGEIDIGVGDLFGSQLANLLVLALGMMGILARAQRRVDAARLESLAIAAVYAIVVAVLAG